jgi:hypothetical protein
MKEDETIENHESFGLLQISRQTCSPPINLFGSSVSHSNLISLTINRAEKHRNLHHDWYFGRESLITVIMSDVQFAEAITSMNMGSGTPVTLQRIGGQSIKPCPEISRKQQIDNEFAKDVKKISDLTKAAAKEAQALLKGSGVIKKEDRMRIAELIYFIQMNVESNLPFLQSSFTKQVDKTIMEAKGECEAFVTNAIHKLGVEALQNKKPKLIGFDDKDTINILEEDLKTKT